MRSHSVLVMVGVAFALTSLVPIAAAQAPGGFIESATDTNVRPIVTPGNIPSRGAFTFPDPYNTRAARLTNADEDCGGSDCVRYVGYSYWRNINKHDGSNTMYIVLGLGNTPTLFSYNKDTEEVQKLGPVLSVPPYSNATAEGFYFSATVATMLYVQVKGTPVLARYDIGSGSLNTVFDVRWWENELGPNRAIEQANSSDDNRVHSATLLDTGNDYEAIGCIVYLEDSQTFRFYSSPIDTLDECQVDKSGEWVVIKQKPFASNDIEPDNRIINLVTGSEVLLPDQNGAGGHSDLGHGWMVAKDNNHSAPNAIRLWRLSDNPPGPGTLMYYDPQWAPESALHISWTNAVNSKPPEQQYVCASGAYQPNGPRVNEIVCFMLDGSLRTLVVAPTMTDMSAPGGGDDYSKRPKGNLDVKGEYFIWTSNVGGSRLEAFIVRVPSHLLTGGSPPPPPGGNDTLGPNEALQPDQSRTSPNGQYTLIYQLDGNLVLYGPSGHTWASNTPGTSPGQTIMQGDGNLVIYDSGGSPVCASGTVGHPGAYLRVHDDGGLIIYSAGGTALWTNGPCL